ncbi:N-acyl-D-aspartate/D-glutamate deacylase [Actinoplanes sp. NBRC 103695]|nr:N-acyl-D-aspartate/D-glutamate deacylase [Actinoplanes sp. NBRC 103695]
MIEDGRIAEVADHAVPGGDDSVVDVSGLVVCPGFIDAHVHAEGALWSASCLEPALAQGVTTVVLGQDGCSWAPVSAATWELAQDYFAAINGRLPGPPRDLTVGELLDGFDRRAQNVAYLVPHGNLRSLVTSSAVPLEQDELSRAVRHLEDALADGAVGMSTGLDYIPSRYGDAREIAALCEPLRAADLVYASHLRAATADIERALGELVSVGEESGVRVHASHLKGQWNLIQPVLHRDAALTYDSYPYVAACSLLAMYVLPAHLQATDRATTLRNLREARLSFDADRLSRLTISNAPAFRSLEGLTVTAAADRTGTPVADFVLRLLRECELEVAVISAGPAVSSEDIRRIASDARHCGGSDGIYLGSRPHPRGHAAFTVLLRMYLDDGAGWLGAAEHLATRPASIFALAGRGDIRAGYAADLAVFDEAAIASAATFDQPAVLSGGLRLAYVNGEVAWSSGSWTGSNSGRALRH